MDPYKHWECSICVYIKACDDDAMEYVCMMCNVTSLCLIDYDIISTERALINRRSTTTNMLYDNSFTTVINEKSNEQSFWLQRWMSDVFSCDIVAIVEIRYISSFKYCVGIFLPR